MKVIIGAGTTEINGWISTQEKEINLLDENTWLCRFEYNSISNMLAEHYNGPVILDNTLSLVYNEIRSMKCQRT